MDFDAAGVLRAIVPQGRRSSVAKRVLDDLNRIALPAFPLVPSCQIIHDRLNLEISRGCTRGCRYCQAGMIYRPVRDRDPAAALAWVDGRPGRHRLRRGVPAEPQHRRLRPPGRTAPVPDGPVVPGQGGHLAPFHARRHPHPGDDGPDSAGAAHRPDPGPGGGDGQRLRRVINKNLTEAAIMDSARRAFAAGWQLLKLYFMIGLPRETKEDREGITALARQILAAAPRGSRPRLNVSLSSFIPKPHTPFQWERQEDLEECRRRLHEVKDRLRQKNIQTKWNSAAQTWLEGVFSRGDRRLAPVLLEAHRRGCRLDAWSEHLRLDPWREAFRAAGVDPDFYLRERRLEDLLPWDHVDCGVSRDFLLAERARAAQELETPDCRISGCQDCGVCDQDRISLQARGRRRPAPGAAAPPAAPNRWPPAATGSPTPSWKRAAGWATSRWWPPSTAACAAPGCPCRSLPDFIPCPGSLFMTPCPWGSRAWSRPWTWNWRPPCPRTFWYPP